ERKDMFAVHILMQAIVIVRSVLEQKWGRSSLPRGMATGKKIGMLVWIPDIDVHCRVPSVAYGCKRRVQRRAQASHHLGQWIRKVLVFAAPKSVPLHHDPAAETIFVGIQLGQ